MKRVDDVIIIGAGIIGLLCAYYLAKENFKVTILEKDFPGAGDTTKTGGGIRYLHGSPINISLSKIIVSTVLKPNYAITIGKHS